MAKQEAALPDLWSIYLEVADAEKTTQQVTELGLPVFVPPMPVGDLGTMARRGRSQRGDDRHVAAGTAHGLRPLDGDGTPGLVRAPHPRLRGARSASTPTCSGGRPTPRPTSPEFRYTTEVEGETQCGGVMDASGFLPEGVPSTGRCTSTSTTADAEHRQGGRARRCGRDARRGHAVRSPGHGHRPHGRAVPPPPVGPAPTRGRSPPFRWRSASGGVSQGVGNLASWRST